MFEYKSGFTFKEVALMAKHEIAQKITISMGPFESSHYFIDPAPDTDTSEFVKYHLGKKDYLAAGRTLIASCRIAGDKIKPALKERLAFEAIKSYLEKQGKSLPENFECPEISGQQLD